MNECLKTLKDLGINVSILRDSSLTKEHEKECEELGIDIEEQEDETNGEKLELELCFLKDGEKFVSESLGVSFVLNEYVNSISLEEFEKLYVEDFTSIFKFQIDCVLVKKLKNLLYKMKEKADE